MKISERIGYARWALLACIVSACAQNDANLEFEADHVLDESASEEIGVQSMALTDCVPNSRQVALFMHTHRQGSCVILNAGTTHPWPDTIGLPLDTISSYVVGSDVYLRGSQHPGFTGEQFWDATTRDTLGWWNDRTSSVQVYLRSLNYPVVFYADPNFTGVLGIAGANSSWRNIVENGLADNTLSSFRLHPDFWIRLCRNTGMGGFCEDFYTSQAYLSNLAIGNDTVSSFQIFRK